MTVRIINADVLAGLAQLPDSSVHCVVTSPPYWGLRDYGTGQWEGGDAECEHISHEIRTGKGLAAFGQNPGMKGGGHKAGVDKPIRFRDECGHCGARRIDDQIGLEPTLAEHIERLVAVFEQVRRVLRPDGVLFLNYGDAYAGSSMTGGTNSMETGKREGRMFSAPKTDSGLKPKDLCLIPHRLAIALQEAGWWVRSDIIWSKPNPMPESVTDRPTNAHEHVFLLTKSARYWWDPEAVREEVTGNAHARRTDGERIPAKGTEQNDNRTGTWKESYVPTNRNLRNVWTIPSYPFSEAHFATFPPKLVETCLKAGCPERVCADCGAPYVREVEATKYEPPSAEPGERFVDASRGDKTRKLSGADYNRQVQRKTLGFSPSCDCQAETEAGTVLDCFGGSGTTGLVADRLSRNAILIELNSEYAAMARKRVEGDSPLFANVELGP